MFGQIREAFKVTKQEKPWIGAALAFIFVAIVGIGMLIGASTGHPFYAAFVSNSSKPKYSAHAGSRITYGYFLAVLTICQ